MAFILADRVKEVTTTTGTGSVVLGGTIDASTTFSAAIGNGNSTYYCIESPDGNYEVGIGIYTSSSNSLSRDTIISSSNSGSKISLVGVSNVFCTQPAPKAVFLDSTGLVSGVDSSFEGFAFPDGTIQYTSATSGNAPITIERQGAGVFFNYFINNAYDETVSLHLENEQFPRFKLGLRDTADGDSAPTYGYLFAEQGSAGAVGDSTCEFYVANNNGFWIKHNSQNIANFAQDDGIIFQNVAAASPTFTVKGNAAQATDLQRWNNSSSTTLAKVTKEGHISGVQLHTPTISFADGTTQSTAGYTGTGDINVNQYIYHEGDSNTYIRFRGDQIDFVAGNVTMLTLDETSQDIVKINDGGNDVDFQVEGDNDANLIRTDAANDRVGIGTSSPSYLLDVAGSGSFETIRFSDGTTQTTSFAADVATASGALRADITSNTAAIPASGYAISGALQSQIDGLSGASISYVDAATASGVANSGFLSEELHEISGVGGLIANKNNWDTAYGWGDHSSAGYLTSQTSHADVLVDGDFSSQGLMKRGFSGGSYSIVTDNSSNWNTAYGWGDHVPYVDAATASGVANSGFFSEELYEVSGVAGLIPSTVADSGYAISGALQVQIDGISGASVAYVDAATASGVANSGFFSEELHEVSGVGGLISSTVADSGYAISGALQVQIDGIGGASVSYVDAATASGVANSGFFSEELHEVSGVGGLMLAHSGHLYDYTTAYTNAENASGVAHSGFFSEELHEVSGVGGLISSTVADSGYAISGALQVQIDGIGGASVSYVDAATASGVANSGFFSEELHEVSGVGGLITSTIANSGYHISGVLQPQITANTTAIPASGYRISGVLQPQISSNTTAIPASGYHISGVLQPQITTNTTAIPASGYHISGILQPQISSNTSNISTNTTAIPASGYHISGILQPQITTNTTAIPASGYHISGVLQPQITTNAAAIPASGYHISGILQTQITNLNHDTLTGFVANEHIDWTADQGGTNIHTGNYDNTTYTAGSGIELQGTEFNVAISGNNILATNTPSDNYVPSYDLATGKFTWVEAGGASDINGLSDCLVENNSIFLGNDPSSTTSTAERNIAIGSTALDAVTTADDTIAIGYNAGTAITTNTSSKNILIGSYAGENLTVQSDENVFIGYEAGHGLTDYHVGSVAIGYHAGYSSSDDRANYLKNVSLGHQAGMEGNCQYSVHIGPQAGEYNAGNSSVAIGDGTLKGSSSTPIDTYDTTAIGAGAGQSSTGDICLYLGHDAGKSNTTNKMLFIGIAAPTSNGTIIKADMDNKHIALGVADSLTVSAGSAALQVYSKDPDDPSIYAQPYLGSEADLIHFNSGTQEMFNVGWDGSITTSGTIYASGAITASGSIVLNRFVPSVTTNALYNDAGTLKFNGATIGGAVDINGSADLGSPATGDELLISDADDSNNVKKADVASVVNLADHDALTNFVTNEHINHTSVTLTAGDGLTGGGDISANRSFAVSVDDSTIEINSDSLRVKDDGITYAKMQHTTADNRLLGAASAGAIGEVQVATAMVADDAITYAKMQHTGTANRVLGAASAGAIGEVQVATAMVADDAITYAKIQNVTDARMLGNNAGSDGAVTEMTKANVLSFLNVADGATAAGTVTAINNATANELVTIGSTTTELDAEANLTFDGSTNRLKLVGHTINEFHHANDSPKALSESNDDSGATISIDLRQSNLFNVVLTDDTDVTKVEFLNGTRGQKFILRITQVAGGETAATVAWTNVDSATGGTAATVRWAGNVVPVMSTSTGHTDVLGFLCTNAAGTAFDGFIIGQDLPD